MRARARLFVQNHVMPLGRWVGWCCLALAGLGLLALADAGLRLAQTSAGWGHLAAGVLPAADPAFDWPDYRQAFTPLVALARGYAWLWPLLGAAGLLLRGRSAPARNTPLARWRLALAAGLLIATLSLGAWIRLAPLWRFPDALAWKLDYDEGVYVSSARAWLQGAVPYRDLWLSHPPTGVALLLPGTALSADGPAMLVTARRTTAVLDLLTGLLAAWVGMELGGVGAGLIAAVLYLLDGTAGRNSTHVWLETAVNFWSVAALGCALRGLRLERERWLIAAGMLAALATTTKYIGVALPAALLLALCAARRWRMAGALVLGGGGVLLVYAVLLLPAGWDNLLRETLVMQMLRPLHTLSAQERLAMILDAPASIPAAVGAAIGGLGLLLGRPARPLGWAIVLAWLAAVLALLIASPTYYQHYGTQLIAPLAILGGGRALLGRPGRPRMVLLAALALLLTPLGLMQQTHLPAGPPPEHLLEGARIIRERTSPSQPLLAFTPLYNLLSDRPPVRAPDGRLLIDSYMHLRGLRAGIDQQEWADLWRAAALRQPLVPRATAEPIETMLQAAPVAAFEDSRELNTLGQRIALARNYRQFPLPDATLYEPPSRPRHFEVGPLAIRGADLPTVMRPGEQIHVSLFWQMRATSAITPFVSLQLVDGDDHKWGQFDKPVGPEGAPFWAWQPGNKTYIDEVPLAIDPQTPPGTYRLLLIIYGPATGQRWPLTAEDGQPLGEVLAIENVTVVGAAK